MNQITPPSKTGDALFYRLANGFAVCAIFLFGLFRSLDYAAQGTWGNLVKMAVFVSIAILALILIMCFMKNDRWLALLAPLAVFASYTVGCVIIGLFRHYFIVYLGLCVLAGVYFQPWSMLRFIFITNLAILGIAVSGNFFGEDTGISRVSTLFIDWVMAFSASVLIYLITHFTRSKSFASVKAEEAFRTLMATTPNLIALLDELNCITYISKPLAEFARIKNPAMLVGRPILDLFGDINIKMMITEILESGGFYEGTREIVWNGESRYFKILSDKFAGNIRGTLIDITDISSVVQAKMDAEAASRSKSDFLARMSHEIRTPLNAVLGLSEVELQGSLSEQTRVNLEKIHHSGSHLLEIVNDILDISKIESGNFEIIPAEYELCGLINDVIQINIVRIGIKPIDFKLDLDKTIPSKLYGDELRIKQILNNLLSNAFKYTEEGKVRLVVGWKQREEKALLWFTVEDTGRGIKKEDLEKLFAEYTQFEAGANRRIDGTGLGLSITKGLVETMGGSIAAESEYGRGSAFWVQLPQGLVDAAPIGREMAEDLRNFRFIAGRNRARGTNLIRSYMPYGKVLVVDDLETNLDVMKGLLMPYGLMVDTVSSGREAVEAIRNEEVRYDLVFMDHMMPEMDGIKAAWIIRNEIGSPYAREVSMVALTANAIAGNREMFLASGFTDFISKPIDIYQLDLVLNRWIRDKQSEKTLQDAEHQQLERAEAGGGSNGRRIDPEGEWLLEHPLGGIDFAAALTLYGNSGAAYLPLLKSFITHTPLLFEKMDLHLETLSPDYAVEVHGLKGTCNAVGAGGTAKAAGELELAFKEGNFDLVRRKHGVLRKDALALTAGLKALLEEWEAGQGAGEKEQRGEPDRALLVRLSAAAAEYNSTVVEELLGELDRYRYERGEEFIAWLREQAESFDYEVMRKRLEEFLDASR